MLTDFYRILGRSLPACLGIFTGVCGEGFRIVYGFLPDFGKEASGLFCGFLPDFGEEASGLCTDFYRISGKMFTVFLRIFTGLWGGGFRIVYGFSPDFGEEASGLLTDFNRILGRRLPDCLRIFTGFWGGGVLNVYGFLPDFGQVASKFLGGKGIGRKGLADCFWIKTGFGIWGRRLTDLGLGKSGC